jgi:hypothetical protein
MKTTLTLILCGLGLLAQNASFSQGLQVNPPSANTNQVVAIPHALYPSTFFCNEPQILSVDLNESGDKVLKIQYSNGITSVLIHDISTEKNIELVTSNSSKASKGYFLNEKFIAIQIPSESSTFEIIEISSSKVVTSVSANSYLGSTLSAAYFINETAGSASIERFDFATVSSKQSGVISGEVFGWYFSKTKGIVGVAIHSNMLSNIYSIENDKLGKSLFEFSSGYYFETKGCNSDGDLFYAITNFQSLTTYACAISKSGIKPFSNKSGESTTDLFIGNNEISLITNNLNAAEYQESQNISVQKILAFAKDGFIGSSVDIKEISEKGNILFCIQGETIKPKYFVWKGNSAKPISSDKYDQKNPTFISSEVMQIQTGEYAPQTGRMYLPTKSEKSSYPLVIYIPDNIFLPYKNQFNPTVQHLCQSGYAVFVWNTRYAYRPKIGFAYSDLIGSLPEDLSLLRATLNKNQNITLDNSFILGEGLGAYFALNISSSSPEVFKGVVLNRMDFPGKKNGQDLISVRMFGEDAQTKWTPIDQITLSEKLNFLSYQSFKSNTEIRLNTAVKQNKIRWTDNSADPNPTVRINARELDSITLWLKKFSLIETKVIEDSPKVDVKKK